MKKICVKYEEQTDQRKQDERNKVNQIQITMQIQTGESLSPTLNLASVIIQNINIFCNTAMNYQDEHPYYLVSHFPALPTQLLINPEHTTGIFQREKL